MPVYGIYRMILEVVGHDQTGNIFQRISSGFASILQYATAIVGAMVFERIASGIGSIISSSISAVAWMQQLDLAISALVAREMVQTGAAGSVGEAWGDATTMAAGLVEQLQDIAILSPYTVESVSQTYKMAMAFGYTTDEAMTFTQALLENAAGIGADNSMLDRMAYNLAQVRLQGKVTALDIRQLALAGFDLVSVLKYTGKQMGVNIEDHLDFNKAIQSGEITWKDFTDSFAKYAEENFSGATERMARSLFGLKSTFHDLFVLTMPRILGPAAESVTKFLNELLDRFIAFRESGKLEEWAATVKGSVDRVLSVFRLLLAPDIPTDVKLKSIIESIFPSADGEKIVDTISNVWATITGVWDWGVGIATEIVENLKEVWSGLKTFWDENGAEITQAITKVFGGLGAEIKGEDQSWIDLLFTPLENFVTWLVDNGPKITDVVGKIADFFVDKLLPAITSLGTFLANNLTPILTFFSAFKIGIGIIFGIAKLIPLIQGVAALIGGITGTFMGPILLIIAGIALLVTAWTQNWGDIQGKTAIVVDWVKMKLAELGNWWEFVLLPKIQVVVAWINENVVPIFQGVANVIGTVVGGAISIAIGWWDLFTESLSIIWAFVQDNIIPLWEAVAELLSVAVSYAVEVLAGWWENTLLPALQDVWDLLSVYLVPIWETIVKVWNETVMPAIEELVRIWNEILKPAIEEATSGWLDTLRSVLDKIGGIIQDVIGWIQDLTDKLKNAKLPSWATRDSPSEIEMTFMGLNDQLALMAGTRVPAVNRALRGMNGLAPSFGGLGLGVDGSGGGISVTVNVDKISSDVDVDRMAHTIARTIQRKRGYG